MSSSLSSLSTMSSRSVRGGATRRTTIEETYRQDEVPTLCSLGCTKWENFGTRLLTSFVHGWPSARAFRPNQSVTPRSTSQVSSPVEARRGRLNPAPPGPCLCRSNQPGAQTGGHCRRNAVVEFELTATLDLARPHQPRDEKTARFAACGKSLSDLLKRRWRCISRGR